jgi:hypothetical protein
MPNKAYAQERGKIPQKRQDAQKMASRCTRRRQGRRYQDAQEGGRENDIKMHKKAARCTHIATTITKRAAVAKMQETPPPNSSRSATTSAHRTEA